MCLRVVSHRSLRPTTSPNRAKSSAAEDGSIPAAPLPVEKVILYKNGVGYFEHVGKVAGNQELGIAFTTAQLNDVLKSLTLVDLNGGRISDVRYNSIAPLEEQLKSLQPPLGEDVTTSSFLVALRGSRVEVRSGKGGAIGKFFSVESVEKRDAKGEKRQVTELALVTDTGELRVFELSSEVTVRTAEDEIHKDVNRYLDLLGTTRSRDLAPYDHSRFGQRRASHLRQLYRRSARVEEHISHCDSGGSRNALSASLGDHRQHSWRRLEECKAHLGFWRTAIVHTEHFAAVLYATASSSRAASGDAHAASPRGNSGGVRKASAERAHCDWCRWRRRRWRGRWACGRCGGWKHGRHYRRSCPQVRIHVGDSGSKRVHCNHRNLGRRDPGKQTPEAGGNVVGDLFEYSLKERITVLKNQSALVPIVQSPIDVEKVRFPIRRSPRLSKHAKSRLRLRTLFAK